MNYCWKCRLSIIVDKDIVYSLRNAAKAGVKKVDTDWLSEDRKVVKDYLYSKPGLYCCDIVTFNTIALKGAVNDIVRGFFRDNLDHLPESTRAKINEFEKSQKDGEQKTPMPNDLVKEIEKHSIHREVPYDYNSFSDRLNDLAEIDEAEARRKYPEIFRYVDLVNGCVVSVGNHPAGCVVSPFPVDEWFGTFTTSTDEYPVSQLNMKEIDSLNFVKLDILGLDNIGLIYKTCDLVGIPFLTPDNTPPDDMDVWNSIKEDTTMIFQWESSSATAYLKQLLSDSTIEKIKAQNPNFSYMDLLSIGNGAIRPAGESYRDLLAQGIYRDNGNEALNNFLSPTLGYLVYQEQIIEFLHKFCGFTMGEADVVRRCVDEDTLVMMANGQQKRIKNIIPGEKVQTFNDNTITVSTVNEIYDNGYANVYEITCENQYTLRSTDTHKVLTQRGWVKASELKNGDYLFTPKRLKVESDGLRPTDTKAKRIISNAYCPKSYALLMSDYEPIKFLGKRFVGKTHVFDLEVETTHNYIANGIVVHNCFAKKTGTSGVIPIIKDGGIMSDSSDHHIKGFIETMKDEYGVKREDAEKNIVNFLQVIQDASDYLFSKNHADPYSWIGYICGYLRYHYPLEFVTTALNIFEGKEEKSLAIIDFAKRKNLKISPIKFRHSIAEYSCDKGTNEIFKGISSIKYMNANVANEMYALRDNEYKGFIELLYDLKAKTSLNSRQLRILIDLDFFSEFGNANYLVECSKLFETYYDKKQLKKDKLAQLGIDEETARQFAGKETAKMFSNMDMKGFLAACAKKVEVKPRTLGERVAVQIEHLGYIDIVDDQYSRMAVVVDVNTKYTPRIKFYSMKNGTTVECKVDKRTFNRCRLKAGDIVKINRTAPRNKMKRDEEGNYTPIPNQYEWWVSEYKKVDV